MQEIKNSMNKGSAFINTRTFQARIDALVSHSETFDKYKAIKYIRLSDADEKPGAWSDASSPARPCNQESNSVANQRKLIDEFLTKHPEIEIYGEKVDDGFSGILFDRPAFNEMMEEIKKGNVNCVVVKDLSRFGREYIETGRYLRQVLPSYGVRFIAINDNIDTLSDNGDDLTVSLKSIINDAYSRDISSKVRPILKNKRINGDYIGSCPVYGYKKDENNRNRLVVDDYPASIVREIFQMKLDGYSAVRIAETLNKRGVLSPLSYKKYNGLPHAKKGFTDNDGAKWSATTIFRILHDETYTGTLVQGKTSTPNYKIKTLLAKPKEEWHKVENTHESIVSTQVFSLVQKVLQLDTRTSPGSDKSYIFSGILICGGCGRRMTRKTVPYKGNKHFYYFCPTGKKNGCPCSAMLKEQDLLDCVSESVKVYIANIAQMENLLAGLDSTLTANELVKNFTVQLCENERKLERIREFKAGLYENMVKGILNKDEYKLLKAKYAEDTEILTQANIHLQKSIEDTLSLKSERMAWTQHFKSFENIRFIDRRGVICLIQSIHVRGKTELEINWGFTTEFETAMELLNHIQARESGLNGS